VAPRISVVGMGLRYPDADNPDQYWQNILGGRRAFRELPPERMNLADYWSPDPSAPDRFYARTAAVLRDFEFNRSRYRVSGPTYRSTDMTHWLALTVAGEAWADAGLSGDREHQTAVIIGNTLTGEFSRAQTMRLRWPYVRRVVGNILQNREWDAPAISAFMQTLETDYKSAFAPVTEDTLAGGLSNTIAGRVCNHFDFRGGGYTVDGACSSSLLATITAVRSLCDGDIDVAITGGVDLSIDPFEVIGFAKTNALATGTMKVYDEDSNGFWPGEGCGMVVLMREEDARAAGARIYANIAGWGISSDGSGGITRPEASGHVAAIEQAYRLAGYPVSTVDYFEGHGTGTAVGDATEIRALTTALTTSGTELEHSPALSSVKGNIGHTKAAAGIAGLIKATLSLHHGVIPPVTGNFRPSPALESTPLHLPRTAETFPVHRRGHVGVSAMGFGGSNAHVTLESADPPAPRSVDPVTTAMVAGNQNAELLVFAAADEAGLRRAVESTARRIGRLSLAELGDLAADLAADVARDAVGQSATLCRASAVVRTPEHATSQLARLIEAIGMGTSLAPTAGLAVSLGAARGRIGFLFPGQGSGSPSRSFLSGRFPAFVKRTAPTRAGRFVDTHVAQPRIASDSAHALAVLRSLGVEAHGAAGHSLGELTALHWSGLFDDTELVRLAAVRGSVMAEHSTPGGAMANLSSDARTVREILDTVEGCVVVAGYNAPAHTVVSGDHQAVDDVLRRAAGRGITGQQLQVSHAFHSPHVTEAADVFAEQVRALPVRALTRPVVSTRTGRWLDAEVDLAEHLSAQMREPVAFSDAVATLAHDVDLLVEVGPGRTLSSLAALTSPNVPALSIDSDSSSAEPFLAVMGAAWTLHAIDDVSRLTAGRVVRPLPIEMTFLASPCEAAPEIFAPAEIVVSAAAALHADQASSSDDRPVIDILREVFAEHTELPLDAITAHTRPLDDLHLSSITVSQLATDAARRLGCQPLSAATNLATVNLGEVADALASGGATAFDTLDGVADWVRAFEIVERDLPAPRGAGELGEGDWLVLADGLDAGARSDLAGRLRALRIGSGVLIGVRDADGGSRLALAGVQAALQAGRETVVLALGPHDGSGAGALVKSFALEHPELRCVIGHLPDVDLASHLLALATEVLEIGGRGFAERVLSSDGGRAEPRLVFRPTQPGQAPLDPGDLLVVSGGAKGIVAESAAELARRWGVALGLLGRADPEADDEVRATLARLRAAGATFRYLAVDVTDATQVRNAVGQLEQEFGTTRGVLHGAGTNKPSGIESITTADLDEAAAVKLVGLRNLLDAVNVEHLRLLVSYASIIGRAGLHGEAHYAAANERLTALTEQFAEHNPHVRTRSLEWSVWEGTGMGVRLGVLESLRRSGIVPLPIAAALRALIDVTEDPQAPVTLVVASRLGSLPTAVREHSEPILLRFVESVKVHYPGIELVADVNLGLHTDLYLADHDLDGDFLFPAVFGLEAMNQAACAVTGSAPRWDIVNAQFLRPITVRGDESTTLRVAALVDSDRVHVVLRSSETSWAADHFRATLVPAEPPTEWTSPPPDTGWLSAEHLYGPLFFQGRRFQQVRGYRHVAAREAVADLDVATTLPWFAVHLPRSLVLGHPGTRDAVMHAIQCCVPDGVLLPVSVDRIHPSADFGHEPVLMHARETAHDGSDYWYDVRVLHPGGGVVEEWRGLHLRSVRQIEPQTWEPGLLGPHLQRSVEGALSGMEGVSVAVVRASTREAGSESALARAAGRRVTLSHGADGRPLVEGSYVSIGHDADVTVAVCSDSPVSCDIEQVGARDPELWSGMLGPVLWDEARTLAAISGESLDAAATMMWTALECLRKAGLRHDRLVLDRILAPGRVVLAAPGDVEAFCARVRIAGSTRDTILCVLAAPSGRGTRSVRMAAAAVTGS